MCSTAILQSVSKEHVCHVLNVRDACTCIDNTSCKCCQSTYLGKCMCSVLKVVVQVARQQPEVRATAQLGPLHKETCKQHVTGSKGGLARCRLCHCLLPTSCSSASSSSGLILLPGSAAVPLCCSKSAMSRSCGQALWNPATLSMARLRRNTGLLRQARVFGCELRSKLQQRSCALW